ncbi:HNH endonuclease [Streptomyces griseosporeus]|uniref:HNH endonuclease n=1 Tax=Streptomyces griseosporeus TaxID=1910 RepID=UPI003700DA95
MSTPITRISRSQAWRQTFIRQHGYRCHYCNRPGGLDIGPDNRPWHIDHKDPLAEGGEDVEENLALACKRCNIFKGTKPYHQFRAYASVALWNDIQDPTTDGEIEELLDAWAGTQQGTWFYQAPRDDGSRHYLVWSRPDGEINDRADDLVAEVHPGFGRHPCGEYVAQFLIRAHRMMPSLIAEIRMLRAEVAEARDETQATEDAA